MTAQQKTRLPVIGLFRVACRRFQGVGEGTADGTYEMRIANETAALVHVLEPDAKVVDPGPVYTEVDMRHAVRMFLQEPVDCVLCLFHSWAEDDVWVTFLRDFPSDIPLLYYYPAKERISYEDCADDNDFSQFLANGGLVGSLVGSGSLVRMQRKAKYIVGTLASAREEILSYAECCRIVSTVHHSRIGIMPAYNEIMWGTYLDPYRMFRLGPEVRFLPYAELEESAKGIDDQEGKAYVRELRDRYPLDGKIDEEKFLASARYSLALADVMVRHDLDVLTLNDVNMDLFSLIGLRPGFYPPSLDENLSVLCPEADLGMALAAYLLKLVARRQVNAVEPFYIDESRNLFCAGHAGPNDHTDASCDGLVKISVDKRFAKTSYRYAGAPFAWLRIPPGEMTMLHVSQQGDDLKMVASLVESLAGPHRIQGYSHSEFRPVGQSVDTFVKRLLAVGTTQHFAVVPGNHLARLEDLSGLLGCAFHAIV